MECQRIKVHRDIDEFQCRKLKVKMYLNIRTLIRIQWSVLHQQCDNVLSPTYQLFVRSVLWSLCAVTRKEQNTWQIKSKDFHSCCRTDRCNVPFHLKPNYVPGHLDTYFWRHQCIMSDIIRTEMFKFQLWKNLYTESRDTWTKQLCHMPNLSPASFLTVNSSAHVKQGLDQKSFEVDDNLSAGLATAWTSPECFVFVTNTFEISCMLIECMIPTMELRQLSLFGVCYLQLFCTLVELCLFHSMPLQHLCHKRILRKDINVIFRI